MAAMLLAVWVRSSCWAMDASARKQQWLQQATVQCILEATGSWNSIHATPWIWTDVKIRASIPISIRGHMHLEFPNHAINQHVFKLIDLQQGCKKTMQLECGHGSQS